jgi:hypothetical protein
MLRLRFINPRYVASPARADGMSVGPVSGKRSLFGSEDGFALPTVLLLTISAFALVAVGLTATANTELGTVRDQQTKAAVQLAQAGVDEAVLAYNRLTPSPTNRCSPVTLTPPDANGWCQVPAKSLNDGTFRSYVQVPAVNAQGTFVPGPDGNITLRVVGQGTMGTTTRRVLVDVKSHGTQLFPGDQVVQSAGNITLNGNGKIKAGTATNGSVVLNNQSSICGPVSVGVGQTVSGSGTLYDGGCTQQTTTYQQQALNLLPLGAAPTTGLANNRLFGTTPRTDPVSAGNLSKACFDGHDGNNAPSTACFKRRLDLQQNTSVTLTGSTYVFCKLTMSSNTSLTVPSGQPVDIWLDSPDNCADSRDPSCLPNTTAPCVQLDMSSNSRITSDGGNPSDVRLLFVGSPTRRSSVNLSSNTDANAACQQNMIIYAPLSDVDIKGGGNNNQTNTYCGALAGRTVTVESNVVLTAGKHDLTLPSSTPYYQGTQFVECEAAPASAPNYSAGC